MANDIIASPIPILTKAAIIWLRPLSQYSRECLTSWIKLISGGECDGQLHNEESWHYLNTLSGIREILRWCSTLSEEKLDLVVAADIPVVFEAFKELLYIPEYLLATTESNDTEEIKRSVEEQRDIVYCTIAEVYHIPPNEARHLTYVQQVVLLKGATRTATDKPGQRTFATEEEYLKWMATREHE